MSSNETVKMFFLVECDVPVELVELDEASPGLIERFIEKGIDTSDIYAIARKVPAPAGHDEN